MPASFQSSETGLLFLPFLRYSSYASSKIASSTLSSICSEVFFKNESLFYLAKNILTPRYFNYKLHNIKKLYTFPYSFNMSRLRYKKQRHGQNCNIIKTGSHKIIDTCGICRGCLSAASSAGAASVSFVNKLPYSFYGRRFVYAAVKQTYKPVHSVVQYKKRA